MGAHKQNCGDDVEGLAALRGYIHSLTGGTVSTASSPLQSRPASPVTPPSLGARTGGAVSSTSTPFSSVEATAMPVSSPAPMANARPSPTPPTQLSPAATLRHHTPEVRSHVADTLSSHQETRVAEDSGPPSWFRPPPDKLHVSLGKPPLLGPPISPSCVDFNFLNSGPPVKSTSHPPMEHNF